MGVGVTHRADVLWRAIHPGRGLADCFPRSHQDHGQRTNGPYDIRSVRARASTGTTETNPLSRDEQLRINKRNQLKRDKVRGLKRVELKLNAEAVEALNELAESRNMSRSELIEEMLMQQLAALRSQGIV